MLEWWDERTVYKLPDLTLMSIATNLVPLRNTRIFIDWISIDGVFGYLSRTTGTFVPVTEVHRRIFSSMLRERPVNQRIEARFSSDMTNKFLFYFMNTNTKVFVHDIYAQENTSNVEVCSNRWESSTEFRVQNVALVKNQLIILMYNEKKKAEKKICFVDL